VFQPIRTNRSRSGALAANTLFALTLAILAGLVFAWVFKVAVLDARAKAPPPAPGIKLTVAAANILDKTQIQASHVKTVTVTEAEYNAKVRDARSRVNGTDLLVGNQPVGRTTLKPVRAEEPIFENQLEPLSYPEPVSSRLRPGKRAVILEIPSTEAMVQVGDVVDVLCTLSNDYFGAGPDGTRTAALVKHARVIARFNTTQTAGRPAPGSTTRTYTLEVNPFRYGLIELAKSFGARLALSVTERPTEEGAVLQASMAEVPDPDTDVVTREALDVVFGVTRPEPEKHWVIERYSGTEAQKPLIYNYTMPAPTPSSRPPVRDPQVRPAQGSPGIYPAPVVPAATPGTGSTKPASGYPQGAVNWRPVAATQVAAAPVPAALASPARSAGSVAGYRPPPAVTQPCSGPGCGKKL
jgi:Flp pilus assembly protein CpaB